MHQKLPRITAARVVGDLVLELGFEDGWQTRVALADFIAQFASLAPLNDPTVFARVAVEEWGNGVTWDDEGPLSLAATTLYRLASEQVGDTARQFDAWMMRHGLSATAAAQALGMTRRTVIHYRTGSRPVPKVVGLACKGWEANSAAAHP